MSDEVRMERKRKVPINEWVNARTGEVSDAFVVIKGKRYPRGTEFLTLFLDGAKELANAKFNASDYRVFFALLAGTDFDNVITLSQRQIAEATDMRQPNVARSIARLLKARVLRCERDQADHRRKVYRLSLSVGWKGDAGGWLKACQEAIGPAAQGKVPDQAPTETSAPSDAGYQ